MEVWKMFFLFQGGMFRFHVSFRGCTVSSPWESLLGWGRDPPWIHPPEAKIEVSLLPQGEATTTARATEEGTVCHPGIDLGNCWPKPFVAVDNHSIRWGSLDFLEGKKGNTHNKYHRKILYCCNYQLYSTFFWGKATRNPKKNIHVIHHNQPQSTTINQAVRMRPSKSKAEPWGDEQLDWALDPWNGTDFFRCFWMSWLQEKMLQKIWESKRWSKMEIEI